MITWQRHKIRHFLIGVVKKCKQTSCVTSLPRVDRRFRPIQKKLGSVQREQKYLWSDPFVQHALGVMLGGGGGLHP